MIIPISQIPNYPDRLDVRTPAEYALDHLPSAQNYPVLSDIERVSVGAMYKQESSFLAKRLGATLIARNIAHHLETAFAEKPRHWEPLIYCWRGGKRSGAMHHILREIGWRAVQLEGGYQAFRRQVRRDLSELPSKFSFRIIGGLTGTGKSRLLAALKDEGGQVLDLETLAQHRGSLLGGLLNTPQPSQKRFETLLWEKLSAFDPTRPLFIESESAKIGNISLPRPLLQRMYQGVCYNLTLPLSARITLLQADYPHFLQNPNPLIARLQHLASWRGRACITRWENQVQAGEWETLIEELLTHHYDPLYQRGIRAHYPQWGEATIISTEGVAPANYRNLAQQILKTLP